MSAMFRTVTQALHFSYVIEQYPVHAMSQMPALIRSIKAEMGVPEESRDSTVNLSGLSPLEARHQCADIRAAVRKQLSTVEAHVLEARFSHDPMVKAAAVAALTRYCLPLMGVGEDIVKALVWRHNSPPDRQEKDWSFREIGETYGISKDKAARSAKALAKVLRAVESAAVDALRDRFEHAGIVDNIRLAA